MNDNRKDFFDIAKGIGIFLVVLGHIEVTKYNVLIVISSFHMPLFFVISGMLMYLSGEEHRSFGTYIKGKLRRIALPYVYFSIAALVMEVIVTNIFKAFSLEGFIDRIKMTITLYGNSVLWFLPALFFSSLIFYLLRRKTGHVVTIFVVLALAVPVFFYNDYVDRLFVPETYMLYLILTMLLRIPIAMFFLATGYYAYLVYNLEKFGKVRKNVKKLSIPVSIVLLIAVSVLAIRNGATDIHFLNFNNPFLYIVVSVGGSCAVLLFSRGLECVKSIAPVKLVAFYGKNSLIVMATHLEWFIMLLATLVGLKAIQYITVAKDYFLCLIMFIVVMILEIPVILFINRFLPFFTGNRKR